MKPAKWCFLQLIRKRMSRDRLDISPQSSKTRQYESVLKCTAILHKTFLIKVKMRKHKNLFLTWHSCLNITNDPVRRRSASKCRNDASIFFCMQQFNGWCCTLLWMPAPGSFMMHSFLEHTAAVLCEVTFTALRKPNTHHLIHLLISRKSEIINKPNKAGKCNKNK